MNNRSLMRYALALAALFVLALGIARAQAPQQAPPESQPGVARVSLIQGNVSTQRGDSGDWVAVTPNTPLAAGDSISTGPGSRAEVQLDYANVLRLSEGASAKIATLTPNQIQVQVGQGLVSYSVVRPGEAAVEIDTPNVAIHPVGAGSYRIQVSPDSETQVAVRNGAADISTPQGSTRVERGQLITIQGTDNPQYQTVAAPGIDDWDRWNGDRDRLITNAESWRHTTPYYVGTHDLDPYGHWTNVNDYGNVWVPTVGPGWAPYRDGRWVWEPYYGWTWVSYEPWGWAPYHYGRWFLDGGAWAWWPGPIGLYPGYRPLWAPAYVSFFGFGRGNFSFGVGFGFGSVGWLPIGPGDFFSPWYGRFGGRRDFVGFGGRDFDGRGLHGFGPLREHGFSNLHEAFRNDRVRGGMTSMAANQFGRGGVPLRQQPINATSLRQGGLMTGGLPMSPSRESFRPTDRAVNPAAIPSRSGTSLRFFTDSRPASASRPFGAQSAQMNPGLNARTNPGFNAGQNGRTFGRANPGANTFAANRTTPQSGWRGFGSGNQGIAGQGGLGSTRAQIPASGTRPSVSGSPSSGWQGFRGAQPGNNSVAQSDRPPASRQNQSGAAGRVGFPAGAAPGGVQRQGGFQPFNAPSRQAQPESGSRNFGGSSGMQPFPNRPAPSYGTGRQGGWQPFNAPSRQVQPESRGRNFGGSSGMQSFPPSRPAPSFSGGRQGGGSYGSSRPPLDLRQSIVTPRGGSSSGYSRPSGGYRGGPTGGRGSNSAPSHSSGRSSGGRGR